MADGYLGIARARLGPSAALISSSRGAAACEENRLTRAREAPTAGPPELAIPELLAYQQISPQEVTRIGAVRDEEQADWYSSVRHFGHVLDVIDADRAHAEYAFAASRFDDALVVVCGPGVTGWSAWLAARGKALTPYTEHVGDFPIARIYSEMTTALGFRGARDEHLVEAMARAGDAAQSDADRTVHLSDRGLSVKEDFAAVIHGLASAGADLDVSRRHVAASVQRALGAALVELLHRLRRVSGAKRVCLSGGLCFNTHFTTAAAHCNEFEATFIPSHPGRSGSAMGAALLVREDMVDADVSSPYLGPGYDDMQVKEALENCKLSYDLQREGSVIETVLRALQRGRLIGWFHGRLEWGPRALGHRTVLADPFSPHVLENLNGYLKKRPWYRSYGVSVPAARLEDLFEVPPGCAGKRAVSPSPFMQYEYRPRDLDKFRTILPPGVQTLRVHTVDEREPRYLRLLDAWGAQSGTPVLVNTSFNGFHEPLVCSPRDAIRVFYGTGLDLLALDDFILRK